MELLMELRSYGRMNIKVSIHQITLHAPGQLLSQMSTIFFRESLTLWAKWIQLMSMNPTRAKALSRSTVHHSIGGSATSDINDILDYCRWLLISFPFLPCPLAQNESFQVRVVQSHGIECSLELPALSGGSV